MELYQCIAKDVVLGKNIYISKFVNAYGCTIGDNTKIGTFVEIQKGASIGSNCKISTHTFICEGVVIKNGVFIGHGVTFINDKYPRAANPDSTLQVEADWKVISTVVEEGASIGSGSTLLCGIVVGAKAIVGAGSVVTKSIPAGEVWAGNPAKFMRKAE